MSEVKVSEPVGAPAAGVWELLGDFGGITRWGGDMIESCRVDGSGVGAGRTSGLRGGGWIKERLDAYEAAGRTLTYSIVEKGPIPLRGYVSICRVVATDAKACRVEWEGRFEPDGASEEQAQGIVRAIYTGGIAAVRKLLGA